jgi:protein TonB
MSYLDQTSRNKPRTIAAVAILHAGLGYLIVSGLAITVIGHVPGVTIAENYEDPPPPPPVDTTPPPRTERTSTVPKTTDPIVKINPTNVTDVDIIRVEPDKVIAVDPGPILPPPPVRSKPDQTRGAEPGTGRGGWVTSEDYPPGPLREGIAGTVGISVAIGIDGRVQGCEVTKSSGNSQLDDATCRLYARRARFKPALDAEGKPTTARYADRIRWELPPQ